MVLGLLKSSVFVIFYLFSPINNIAYLKQKVIFFISMSGIITQLKKKMLLDYISELNSEVNNDNIIVQYDISTTDLRIKSRIQNISKYRLVHLWTLFKFNEYFSIVY